MGLVIAPGPDPIDLLALRPAGLHRRANKYTLPCSQVQRAQIILHRCPTDSPITGSRSTCMSDGMPSP